MLRGKAHPVQRVMQTGTDGERLSVSNHLMLIRRVGRRDLSTPAVGDIVRVGASLKRIGWLNENKIQLVRGRGCMSIGKDGTGRFVGSLTLGFERDALRTTEEMAAATFRFHDGGKKTRRTVGAIVFVPVWEV